MLTAYDTQTRTLLQNPGAPVTLYSAANITSWINIARGQLAGEAECIRVIGTIPTVVGQRAYNFSDINVGVAATTGIKGPINVRAIQYGVASGQQWIAPRPWEWFQLYGLNNPVPENGVPQMWSQLGQGASNTGTGSGAGGSFYLDPPPDIVYTLYCDVTCYPQALVDDSTVEAIPYLFTDAVPFFAAYYALLSAQTGQRQADAARMFEAYTTFVERARKASNPPVNRWMYNQSQDPTLIAKLGLQQKANG